MNVRVIFFHNVREERLTRLFEEGNLILLDADVAVDAAFVIVEDLHASIVGDSTHSVNRFSEKLRRGNVTHEIPEGDRIVIKALIRIFEELFMLSPFFLSKGPGELHLNFNLLVVLCHVQDSRDLCRSLGQVPWQYISLVWLPY